MADPWNHKGSGRMRRDHEMKSRSDSPPGGNHAAWEYANARTNEYDELGVQELLHGLEAESDAATRTSFREPVRLSGPVDSEAEVVCHACQRKSPAGQRFCGYCGTQLVRIEPPVMERARETWPFTPAGSGADSEASPRQAWPTGSGGPGSPGGEFHDETELQFLRHTVAPDGWEESGHLGWKILVAVLVLGVAGFAGYRWLYAAGSTGAPQQRAAQVHEAPSSQEQSEARLPQPAQPPAQQPSATVTKPENTPAAGEGTSPSAAENATPAPIQQSPAHLAVPPEKPEPTPAPPPSPAVEHEAPVTEGGQQELATAERYLYGADGPRDPTEAAKWLWRAVGKQNGTAILLLSELYAKGDGVTRNCDQARLLLMSAVRKKVPDSVTQLRRLELSGCQ